MAKKDTDVIAYVIYDKDTKRPLRQGSCLRKEYNLVVQALDNRIERAKILKNPNEQLDLTPYDLWIGDGALEVQDPMMKANLAFALRGKTADDAITSVDDLDTE